MSSDDSRPPDDEPQGEPRPEDGPPEPLDLDALHRDRQDDDVDVPADPEGPAAESPGARRQETEPTPVVRITTDPRRRERNAAQASAPVVAGEEPELEGEPVPDEFERPGGRLSKVDGHLVMYHEPRSLHAEQYRSCRTNLVALNRGGAPWALVVTSSQAGEGKSVTAANLAVCMAELPGSRVCLVDCDFRAPTQSTVFGQQPGQGLTELIVDDARWSEVVRETVIPDLDIIPAGREPESTAELLGSDRFNDLVHELKRRYTWIILDTPPVHPYTDACVLSSVANGALIVVRLQETPRELVNRTIDSITTAGGRVLGTFLTGLQPDRDETERQQYYRVPGSPEGSPEDADKRREQLKREKHLKKQERAWLKKQRKAERARDLDDEEAV